MKRKQLYVEADQKIKTYLRLNDKTLENIIPAVTYVVKSESCPHGLYFLIDLEDARRPGLAHTVMNWVKNYPDSYFVKPAAGVLLFGVSLSALSYYQLNRFKHKLEIVKVFPEDLEGYQPTKNPVLFVKENKLYLKADSRKPTKPVGYDIFEEIFKGFDWYYSYSDDAATWRNGEKQFSLNKERCLEYMTAEEFENCVKYQNKLSYLNGST